LQGHFLDVFRQLFELLRLREEISHMLRIERVDPLAYHECLVKQLNFPLLLRVGRLEAIHVDVALQMHTVDVDYLLHHLVKQVHPPQTYLCVDLVGFAGFNH